MRRDSAEYELHKISTDSVALLAAWNRIRVTPINQSGGIAKLQTPGKQLPIRSLISTAPKTRNRNTRKSVNPNLSVKHPTDYSPIPWEPVVLPTQPYMPTILEAYVAVKQINPNEAFRLLRYLIFFPEPTMLAQFFTEYISGTPAERYHMVSDNIWNAQFI
jgi:hypothetical protein